MSKKYSRSPILEAVCEIRFQNKKNWDWTIPGLFYNEIRGKFPLKKEIKGIGVGFELKSHTTKELAKYSSNIVEKMEGMQFLTQEKNEMIQIRENRLSIHIMKPYSSWEVFKPMIIESLDHYSKIAEIDGITQIGLRYINQFDSFPDSFRIEDYFNYNLRFPNMDQDTIGEIILKSSIPIPNSKNMEGFMKIILVLNKLDNNLNQVSHILDLDMIYLKDQGSPISNKEIPTYIEKAHMNILNTFESIITDEIRKKIE